MKDEIIRIILEAKDKMSGVVRNAENNINQSFGNIRNDLRKTDKDFNQFQNDFTRSLNKSDSAMKRWSTSMRGHLRSVQDSITRTRKDLEKPIDFGKTNRGGPSGDPRFPGRFTSRARDEQQQSLQGRLSSFGREGGLIGPREQASLDILKQEIKEWGNIIRRSPVGRGVSEFKKGFAESQEISKEIRDKIAGTKEEIKLKRQQVRDELQDRKDALAILDASERDILARRLRAEEINAQKLNREAREAESSRQDLRDQRVAARSDKIRKRNDDEEAKRLKELNNTLYLRARSTDQEIYKRQQASRKEIRVIQGSDRLTKTDKEDLVAAERFRLKEEVAALREARKQDARARTEDNIQINRENLAARNADLKRLEDANARVRAANSKEVDEENRKRLATARAEAEQARSALSATLTQSRRKLEQRFRERLAGIGKPGQEADLVKELRQARADEQAFRKDTDKVSYALHALGNAWGDAVRGFLRGRSVIRDGDKAARAADTTLAKFGQTVGRLTKNVGNLVNLRWYILISAIQVLGQLVLVLASNLVSLASSAALAASALGAGLAAAVSQAIPVVGLLAAAFSRVGAAFTAAQQANKANAQSSQDSRAQAEAQTSAQQALTDALYSQTQAVKALADARKQAQRDIVDAIFAERDANYALKDAEFAVLDAKQRLRDLENQNRQNQQAVKDAEAAVKEAKARLAIAKAEGDAAEIEKARIALALAQQNLSDAKGQSAQGQASQRQIKEQKLAVKEAQLQLEEARVAAKRQRQDTKEIVAAGVQGSKAVVDALHGVAQANREVANAQQGVTDASKKQASAGNLLQRQLSQLDPAERKLYETFRAIQKKFKEIFRPITDIIVNAVSDAVKRFGRALDNPEIINGFKGLANAISKGIGDLSKFFTSKSFLHDFAGFIHAATSNIPTLIKIIENLTSAFVGLAKAGQPIVKDLLGRFAGVTGSLSDAINAPAGTTTHGGHGQGIRTTQQTKGQEFISKAKNYLDSWIKLADAIGRVFKYLFLDAAPSGNSLVVAMTRMFNNLANFLKNNPQKVKKFFDGMEKSLKEIASALFPVVKVLLSAFTGSNAAAFTKFTTQVVIPGLTLMLQTVQVLTRFLLFLTQIPFAKQFLQILVAEKALNRVFPATQRVTDAVKNMGGWFFKAGEDGSRGFTKIGRSIPFVIQRIKGVGKAIFEAFRIPALGKGISRASEVIVAQLDKARKAFVRVAEAAWAASKRIALAMANAIKAVAKFVWEMAVAAVNAMKSFAKALAEVAIAGLRTFVAFITGTVIPALVELGIAMYASLGPWGLIAAAVIALIAGLVLLLRHFHLLTPVLHFFENIFKDIFNWVKSHWKLLAAILLGPFGLAIYGIIKFRHQIYDVFKSIVNWVKDHWKGLAQILIAIFVPGGIIIAAIWKWHDKIVDIAKKAVFGIGHFFEKLPHLIWNALKPLPKMIFDLFKNLGKKIGHEIFSWVPKKLQGPLSKALGLGKDIFDATPVGGALSLLHATGAIVGENGVRGHDRPHGTDTVKAWLTPGEWVLNKEQQQKIAARLNSTTRAVADFIFKPKAGDAGGGGGGQRHAAAQHGGGGGGRKRHPFPFDLVAETDQDGNVVYFIETTTGQFLELSTRDALKMLRTGGKYVPRWIHNHGFTLKRIADKARQAGRKAQQYATGGIVMPDWNWNQSYAMGGVITSPQSNYNSSSVASMGGNVHHKKVEQNFEVHTKGETDWNYVMRLAAMHAESSF